MSIQDFTAAVMRSVGAGVEIEAGLRKAESVTNPLLEAVKQAAAHLPGIPPSVAEHGLGEWTWTSVPVSQSFAQYHIPPKTDPVSPARPFVQLPYGGHVGSVEMRLAYVETGRFGRVFFNIAVAPEIGTVFYAIHP